MEHSSNILFASILEIGGSPVTLLEALVAAGLVVIVILVMGRRRREAESEAADSAAVQDAIARVAAAQIKVDARLEALAQGAASSQETLRRAVDDRLETVTKRLGDGLAATHQRTTESLRHLHERLALIDRAQENIAQLAGEVSGLQSVLANTRSRGDFGELQMQDLVKTFLPASAYEFQVTLSNRTRVDCLIKLPDPPGSVAVDSKFPLETWRALNEAQEPAAREAAARGFRNALTGHVKAIADKYLVPGETSDTALMFVPSEAVYATAHAEFPDVIQQSFRRRVMIVSPTTFMATLHTMRAVMRDARMREQAHVIQREVGALADDVARLDDRVAKLQRHFDQAGEDVRQIRISTEKVVRRAARVEEAQVDDAPGSATPLDAAAAARRRVAG